MESTPLQVAAYVLATIFQSTTFCCSAQLVHSPVHNLPPKDIRPFSCLESMCLHKRFIVQTCHKEDFQERKKKMLETCLWKVFRRTVIFFDLKLFFRNIFGNENQKAGGWKTISHQNCFSKKTFHSTIFSRNNLRSTIFFSKQVSPHDLCIWELDIKSLFPALPKGDEMYDLWGGLRRRLRLGLEPEKVPQKEIKQAGVWEAVKWIAALVASKCKILPLRCETRCYHESAPHSGARIILY